MKKRINKESIIPIVVALLSIIGTLILLTRIYKTENTLQLIKEPSLSSYADEIYSMLDVLSIIKYAFMIPLIIAIAMFIVAVITAFIRDKRLSLLLLILALLLSIVSAVALKTLTMSDYSYEKYVGGVYIAPHYATNPIKSLIIVLQILTIFSSIPIILYQSHILTIETQKAKALNIFFQRIVAIAISIVLLVIVAICLRISLGELIRNSQPGQNHFEEVVPFKNQTIGVLIATITALIFAGATFVFNFLLYKKQKPLLLFLLKACAWFEICITAVLVIIHFCVFYRQINQIFPVSEAMMLLVSTLACCYLLYTSQYKIK